MPSLLQGHGQMGPEGARDEGEEARNEEEGSEIESDEEERGKRLKRRCVKFCCLCLHVL